MRQTHTKADSAAFPGGSQVLILPDRQSISREAAVRFVSLAQRYDPFSVALSGGSTPRLLYEMLAQPPFRDQVPWDSVHLFWGDERCVPPDHADSNYRMAREALLDQIAIPPENVHRIRGELSPPKAAALYEAELDRILETGGRFDLALLGMGTDGHTASLFPDSPTLQERQKTVIAVYTKRLRSWRVTLTLPVLNQARHVLLMVSGASKADALQRIRDGESLPAALVRPAPGDLTWLVDQEASRDL